MQRLFQYANALCQQRDDALDVLQSSVEAYLRAVKRRGGVINNPVAFIRASIRNRFIDTCRAQGRWQSDSYEEGSAYDISPIDIETMFIAQHELEQVWAELDIRDRDILYHWAVLGYSTDEACEILGVARGTFLSRLNRLRKKLNEKQDASGEVRGQAK